MYHARPGSILLHDRGPILPVIISGPSGSIRTNALIDTGSSVSSVDLDLLKMVGALKVGTSQVQTVTGTSALPLYAATMAAEDGQCLLDGVPGVVGDELPTEFQALIGRDVLGHLAFGYDGAMGSWSLGDEHQRGGLGFWELTGAVALGHLAAFGGAVLFGVLATRAAIRNVSGR